jgi:hypothetical protein
MLQIIVILLVAYILIPLIVLTLKERILFAVEVVVYIATFVWVAWTLFHGKPVF